MREITIRQDVPTMAWNCEGRVFTYEEGEDFIVVDGTTTFPFPGEDVPGLNDFTDAVSAWLKDQPKH